MLQTSKKQYLEESARYMFTNSDIDKIVYFDQDEPFEILGPHLWHEEQCLIINAFLPRAKDAWVKLNGNKKCPMRKIHPNGFFQAIIEDQTEKVPYTIGFIDETDYAEEGYDPYTFASMINDVDVFLHGEGSHFKCYEKMGAHCTTMNGIDGVHFAVWAPNARCVSVVGNFNHWIAGAHPMNRIHFSGMWGLFIPGLEEGEVYKYAIKSYHDSGLRVKTDPYGFQAELRPSTASIVASAKPYPWKDEAWIERRASMDQNSAPVSIYEVHLGSWKRDAEKDWGFLSYKDLAHELVDYVKEMGFTHIELMPVMEHPLDESWGYQVISYFAPTSRFGKPQDFKYFVDHCHRNGIGVILDWVPAHFPKDQHGLADFDGRQIYAYEDWKKGEHREWGTHVFDYSRNEVRNYLIANALYWLDKFHIDGLRVDAVASMIYLDYSRKHGEWEPNIFGGRENLEALWFMKQFNEVLHYHYPGILTIAEESTAWAGVSRPTYLNGLGFSMKWNMGWMNDTLSYFSMDPIYRRHHQGELTFSMIYAYSENFVLPISHDEVVHGKGSLIQKMPGDDWQKFANVRLYLAYMYAHPGKKLLFMGTEFGQRSEWKSQHSLDWHLLDYEIHQQLHQFVKDLNKAYLSNRALFEVDFQGHGFEWIDFSDAGASVLSFIRWSWDRQDLILCTFNMTPVPRLDYRVGVPISGFYREVLNTDATEFGGSGIGNQGGRHSEDIGWHG
ncbi:MAG: 1,4-alpha-glucan branching protein GlgB, partial [Chlamydiota bacterium]|nr:1,4-alpha-glucan branching protein GlgB [Chlamydiota bacterium]